MAPPRHREDVDPAGHRGTGWAETPRQRGGVGANVLGPILLEHEACQKTIEKLLSLVAQRLSPYKFSFWIDERHVFRICSLDGRPSAFRVPLGKDPVQVAVKQLLRVWHATSPLVVIRPQSGSANSRVSDTLPRRSRGGELMACASAGQRDRALVALPNAVIAKHRLAFRRHATVHH
jgi:hypothetical protein